MLSIQKETHDLPQRVLGVARKHGLEDLLLREPIVVGVSGGADSLALLHILRELRGPDAANTLRVAHLNHGFRGDEAEADAQFVLGLCEQWGIPCVVGRFDVPAYARTHRMSSEGAARQVRYSFLADAALPWATTIAVAHTADDQAETVLMNILRGAGVSGLTGMQSLARVPVRPYEPEQAASQRPIWAASVMVFRPLLSVWRAEIEEYCAQNGLYPRVDATNQELSYRRNRIRHELLPLLQQEYSPAIKERLYTLSQIASGEDKLVEELVDAAWNSSAVQDAARRAVRFGTSEIAALPEALRRRLVRRAIYLLVGTLEGFTFEHIQAALAVLAGEVDSPGPAHLPLGVVAERYAAWSVISRPLGSRAEPVPPELAARWPIVSPGAEYPVVVGKTLVLDAGWELRSAVIDMKEQGRKPGPLLALFDLDALRALGPLVLRTRHPGDFIQPLGMEGSKSLQDALVDAKIPRRVRDLIPMLALTTGGEILWLPGPGGRRSEQALITPFTKRVLCLEFVK